ncbi:MAG: hypothetical protein ACLGHJ_00820 [Gammaproteobacteria bacterium]
MKQPIHWTSAGNTFRGSNGSEVVFEGRAGFRFRDHHGEYFVDGEMLMGNPAAVVMVDAIWRVRDGIRSPESRKRRRQIAEQIRAAFASQGLVVEIV